MITSLAIDPGSEKSAWVLCEVDRHSNGAPWGVRPVGYGHEPNLDLRWKIKEAGLEEGSLPYVPDVLVIECLVTVFGGAAAARQIETERWGGRIIEAAVSEGEIRGCGRPLVLQCSSPTAKAATIGKAAGNDSQVRRAIIDMYGGDDVAFGRRCQKCKGKGWFGRGRPECPECGGEGYDPPRGPLHGWTGSHLFRALACAIAAFQPGGLYDEEMEES